MKATTSNRRRVCGTANKRQVHDITDRRASRFWRKPDRITHWRDLPLLEHCGAYSGPRKAPERAVRYVQNLLGVSTSTARLYAERAGLNLEDAA